MEDRPDLFRQVGSRARLIGDLREMSDGCLGSPDLRKAARDGADELARGATSVRVRHFVYEVAEEMATQ